MKPMTKDELYNKAPTASETRYWTANILLAMANAPDISPPGKVAASRLVVGCRARRCKWQNAALGGTRFYSLLKILLLSCYYPETYYFDEVAIRRR
jgi:hypothetical protein